MMRCKLGYALDRQLNHDKSHWTMPGTGLGVSYQLYWWGQRRKYYFIECKFASCKILICVLKNFAPFYTQAKHLLKTGGFDLTRVWGGNAKNQSWKGENSLKYMFDSKGSAVD